MGPSGGICGNRAEERSRPSRRLVLSERSESNGFLDSACGLAWNDILIVIPTEGVKRPSGGIYGNSIESFPCPPRRFLDSAFGLARNDKE